MPFMFAFLPFYRTSKIFSRDSCSFLPPKQRLKEIITNIKTTNIHLHTYRYEFMAAPIPMHSNCVRILIQLVTNVYVCESFESQFYFCCCCCYCVQSILLVVWLYLWDVLSFLWRIHWRSLLSVSEWTNRAKPTYIRIFLLILFIYTYKHVTHKLTHTHTWHECMHACEHEATNNSHVNK